MITCEYNWIYDTRFILHGSIEISNNINNSFVEKLCSCAKIEIMDAFDGELDDLQVEAVLGGRRIAKSK